MKTNNIEDWTFEEILEGVGETFDGMLTQKWTKNEPLYPVIRNALRWLVVNYLESLGEIDEILPEEDRVQELPPRGEDEGQRNWAKGRENCYDRRSPRSGGG